MKTAVLVSLVCLLGIGRAPASKHANAPSELLGYALVQANGEELELVRSTGERLIRKAPVGLSLLHGSSTPNYMTLVAAHQAGMVALTLEDPSIVWSWPNLRPEWPISVSENGELAYGLGGRVYVANPSTKTTAVIADGTMPSWRPGSDRAVLFESNNSVKLIRDFDKAPEVLAAGTQPVWAPDGRAIVYRTKSDTVELLHLPTQSKHVLFDARDVVGAIRWTPSEKWIYFVRRGGRYWYSIDWFASEPRQVVIRNLDTGAEFNIFEVYKGNAARYTWVVGQ